MSLQLQAPQPLETQHRVDYFHCGEAVLDDWLKQRALANHQQGASRTFVVTDLQQQVYGYYALAAGAVTRTLTTGHMRRNMPNPIPVIVLARLAVDSRAQGIKLGAALLKDAVTRSLTVSHHIGVRALLVHALHAHAQAFYQRYGFQVSPQNPLLLMLPL